MNGAMRTGLLGTLGIAAVGCAGPMRQAGTGPRVVASVSTVNRGIEQLAWQVDDSAYVAILTFDSTGSAQLTTGRGGAGAVRTNVVSRYVTTPGGSAGEAWSETRCSYGISSRASLTAAEMTGSGAGLPMGMTCTSAPSGSAPSAGRTYRVAQAMPVLVVASSAPFAAEGAARALDLWKQGGGRKSEREIAERLAPGGAWRLVRYAR